MRCVNISKSNSSKQSCLLAHTKNASTVETTGKLTKQSYLPSGNQNKNIHTQNNVLQKTLTKQDILILIQTQNDEFLY